MTFRIDWAKLPKGSYQQKLVLDMLLTGWPNCQDVERLDLSQFEDIDVLRRMSDAGGDKLPCNFDEWFKKFVDGVAEKAISSIEKDGPARPFFQLESGAEPIRWLLSGKPLWETYCPSVDELDDGLAGPWKSEPQVWCADRWRQVAEEPPVRFKFSEEHRHNLMDELTRRWLRWWLKPATIQDYGRCNLWNEEEREGLAAWLLKVAQYRDEKTSPRRLAGAQEVLRRYFCPQCRTEWFRKPRPQDVDEATWEELLWGSGYDCCSDCKESNQESGARWCPEHMRLALPGEDCGSCEWERALDLEEYYGGEWPSDSSDE